MGDFYEVLDHTADTGVRVVSATVEGLFEKCAAAMFAIMVDEPGGPSSRIFDIDVVGATLEELLVAWLSELLIVADTEHVVLSGFDVQGIDLDSVQGQARGWPASGRELTGPPVKAVTYHRLAIVHEGGNWQATVIFDV